MIVVQNLGQQPTYNAYLTRISQASHHQVAVRVQLRPVALNQQSKGVGVTFLGSHHQRVAVTALPGLDLLGANAASGLRGRAPART